MGAFGGFVLTNKGRNLQAKAQTGVTLNYTRMGVGDGQLGGQSIPALTKLIGEKKSLAISKLKIQTQGRAVIGAVLSNQDVTTGFYFREIGIYAQDPDEGEILYCYGNAGANAEYIPPVGGADIIEKSIDAIVVVGNAANVTAEIDKSLVFASQNDLAESEKRLKDYAESHLESVPSKSFTLENGLQVVSSERTSRFKLESLKGRTLVNLMGKLGGFESTSGWTLAGNHSMALNGDCTTGKSSIEVTSTGQGGVGNHLRAENLPLTNGQRYIVIADLKAVGEKSLSIHSELFGSQGNIFRRIISDSWATYTFALISSTAGTQKNLYFWADNPGKFRIDSVRIYEATKTEYDAVVNNTILPDQIAAKYPYVESIQHTTNPYIIKTGENLAPSSNEWERGNASAAEVIFKGPYTADISHNPNQNIYARFYAPVMEGQAYTVSAQTSPSNATAYYYFTDRDKNRLTGVLRGSNTSPLKTAYIEVVLKAVDINLNPISGTVTYFDVMVNIGTFVSQFKPREDNYLYFPDVKLASNSDGSISDEIIQREGKYWKISRYREIVLDGGRFWSFNIAAPGLKRFMATGSIPNYVDHWKAGLTKFDGRVLNVGNLVAGPDCFTFEGTDQLYITVSNADSGWGDNYTPSPDEIKAYFHGWRMYYWNSSTQKTELYNNQGSKSWEPILNTEGGAETSVLPTTKWKNHTSYRLTYQLSQPCETEIIPEGAITLHEGLNQIETGTGMIVRERANPRGDVGFGWVYLAVDPAKIPRAEGSQTSTRVSKIKSIYRNRIKDGTWKIDNNESAYGKQRAYVWFTDYDASSIFEITYLALDQHALTAPVGSMKANTAANLKTAVDRTTTAQSDVETRVSILERDAMSKNGGNMGKTRFFDDASIVDLIGRTHSYLTMYPEGIYKGRKMYLGFPAAGSKTIQFVNEYPTGDIQFNPGAGGKLTKDGFPIWDESRLRMNNGTLEYLDGSTWKAVSGGMEQYKPIVKRQTIVLTGNQTLNAMHLTGKCYLSRIAALSGGLGRLRVFVDGSLYYDSTLVINYVNGIFQNNDVSYNSDSSLAVYQPTLRPSSGNIGYNSSNSSYGRVSDFPNSNALQGSTAIISQPIFAKSSIVIELTNTSTSSINMDVDFAGGVFQ
ncbi:phage tail protein [Paenibacillus chitinolyticus]|uniref:phage tail-collar fiber domain-containing protein n=1 Tax=Paenibacillus chitinolyticus TaxID=79263 RepID=UPI00386644F0